MVTANTSTDSKTAFLVGDDSSTMNLYCSGLEQAGFRTASAIDAVGAFEALPNLSADLIILDLMLPKLGGFELLKAIRQDNRHKATPVLILSNAYLPDMAQKALRAGGNKALTKSECTSSELISVSRELVGIPESGGTAGLAEQLEKTLIEGGSAEVAAIQQQCRRYAEVVGSEESKEQLDKVYQSIRFLSARAGLAGCWKVAQLTGAIEAMLFDQVFRMNSGMSGNGQLGQAGTTGRSSEAAPPHAPAVQIENHKLKIAHYRMSPSSIQTLVQAVDCLGRLFDDGKTGSANSPSKARVLQVDDDAVCNMANEGALKRANYDTVSATNGSAALDLLNDNPFDLVLLDINMPGMNGIELCQKLRCIPHHKNTPVIFVTHYNDFQNRAQSLLSGGDDLISKPISPSELIVKATVFLLSRSTTQVPGDQLGTTFRAELNAHPDQTRVASDGPSTDNQPDGVAQPQSPMAEQSNLEGRTKKLHTVQATVDEKLKHLRKALAEETKQREAVEQQAAENASRRSKLEAAIEENQRAQERFRQLLEESQQQAPTPEQGGAAAQLNLAGRKRALEQVRDFVADKLIFLKKALEAETKRREEVEQLAAANAKRRTDLETALGEIQQVQDAFQQELEIADNPKKLLELESALAESQQAREKLASELEAVRRELQGLRDDQTARKSELETRTKELLTAQAEVELKMGKLKEALAAETARCEAVRQRAAEHARCRGELEAALAQNEQTEKTLQREMEASDRVKRRGELQAELQDNKQAQAQSRHGVEEAQDQLRAQREQNLSAQNAKLEARTQELQAAQAEVEQQVQRLTEALAEETRHREEARQQAVEIGKRRSELEAEMGQLQQQLDEARKQQQAQQESSRVEQSALEARTHELQTAGAEVGQQVKQLKEALTEETRRREGVEQQAGEIGRRRSELEAELGQLRQQLDVSQKQLQTNRTTVEEKIKSLIEALAAETKRREAAEQQAAQLAKRKSELEAELAANQQVQAQLRHELEEVQKQLQVQKENYLVEKSRLEARTQELQTAQAAAEQRVKSLTETLAQETRQRQDTGQAAGEMSKRQGELEAELAENQQAQGRLRHELKEVQKQLQVQKENYLVEKSRLEARTQELQTAQAAAEQTVKRVTEALAQETRRREGAEQQAGEMDQRRSELEAKLGQLAQQLAEAQDQLEAEMQLRLELQLAQKQMVGFLELAENQRVRAEWRQQFEEAQKQLQVQKENYLAEHSRLEARTKELQAALAAADQNQQAQAQLQNELEEVQKQLQALKENYLAEHSKLEARTQELQAAQAAAEQKAKSLTEALDGETKRREAVERLAVDAFKRRRELEAQLAKHQETEKALQGTMAASDDAKVRGELETQLTENQQAQAQLQNELEEVQKQLRAQKEHYLTEQSRLQAGAETLQAAQAQVEQTVKRVTEALAQETRRREGAEQQTGEMGQRRSELEAKLGQLAQQLAEAQDQLEAEIQLRQELRQELEKVQGQLQAQAENSRAEQARLEARTQELQAARAAAEQKVKQVTEESGEAAKRVEAAERQVGEIGKRLSELEAQLAEYKQEQARLRQELEESEKQLDVQLKNYFTEQSRLEARAQELQAGQAAAEQKAKSLTEALAGESKRVEAAEQQVGEIGKRCSEREAQLAENKQEQEKLRQELLESQKQLEVQQENYIAEQSKLKARTQELEAISSELAAVRTRMQEESLQGRKLAERVVEVERAKTELGKQADAARDLVNAKENFIGSLDSQIQERQEKVNRLESLLQSETAERQRERSRAEALEKQTAQLTGQLAEKLAAQQRLHQRQSLLKQCIRRRKDQIAQAVAAARIGEDKLKSLGSIIDDLRVVQSALCGRVRELTTQHDLVSQRVNELNDQSRTAAQTIQARDQQLAALRHAILDAAHLGTNVSRERLRVERQAVKGWKRLMAALLHTPLSTRQRGLVAEILGALEGWDTGRAEATKGVEFRVEPPDLRHSEFNFAEVIERALAAVRQNADETGTKVQTALVGPVPELVRGNAQQIHQLITTLATSLPRYGRAKSLEVKISFEAKSNGTAGMLLSLLLSPAPGDGTLRARLTTLAKQSATLRAVRRGGSKLALSAAWQLALALGGSPSIETTAERKVRVLIPLPLLVTLSLVSENETGQSSAATNGEAAQPSDSGRRPVAGHGQGQRE